MKATGVVRRIDDLGRIVIPKEIRKNLRIREGESLEIYVSENDNIVLKKYSIMTKLEDLANAFTDSIYFFTNKNVIISDRNSFIAVTGPLKKEYLNKEISERILTSINRRENILENHKKEIELVPDKPIDATYALSTIVTNGDAVGMVMIISTDDVVDEVDAKIVKITAKFLEKHLEE